MENRMLRRICFVVAISGVPALSMAQGQVAPAEFGNRALSQVPSLTMAQLSDLVAPIALYPDALLSQVLVASTYPLEVVQAQQWLRRNELLQGQKLMDAARQQPWDASVQGLVAFPDALSTLSQDVQWTTELGNAFLAQESDVMVAVQRLRTQAQAAGRLASDEQQTVSAVAEEGRTVIEIVPANPEVIYVPQYDPYYVCLLYTSDAADERSSVDLGGRRIIKKKTKHHTRKRIDTLNEPEACNIYTHKTLAQHYCTQNKRYS